MDIFCIFVLLLLRLARCSSYNIPGQFVTSAPQIRPPPAAYGPEPRPGYGPDIRPLHHLPHGPYGSESRPGYGPDIRPSPPPPGVYGLESRPGYGPDIRPSPPPPGAYGPDSRPGYDPDIRPPPPPGAYGPESRPGYGPESRPGYGPDIRPSPLPPGAYGPPQPWQPPQYQEKPPWQNQPFPPPYQQNPAPINSYPPFQSQQNQIHPYPPVNQGRPPSPYQPSGGPNQLRPPYQPPPPYQTPPHVTTTPTPAKSTQKPIDVMADITNHLGTRILLDHASARGNFVFSPYGATSVLAVLHEGATGASARQLAETLDLPRDIDAVRVGMRDLHRHLKSYFGHNGFLQGVDLSHNNTSLRSDFVPLLRFYGYHVDESGNQTTVVNTSMTTTMAPVTTMAPTTTMAPDTTMQVPATTQVTDMQQPTDATTGHMEMKPEEEASPVPGEKVPDSEMGESNSQIMEQVDTMEENSEKPVEEMGENHTENKPEETENKPEEMENKPDETEPKPEESMIVEEKPMEETASEEPPTDEKPMEEEGMATEEKPMEEVEEKPMEEEGMATEEKPMEEIEDKPMEEVEPTEETTMQEVEETSMEPSEEETTVEPTTPPEDYPDVTTEESSRRKRATSVQALFPDIELNNGIESGTKGPGAASDPFTPRRRFRLLNGEFTRPLPVLERREILPFASLPRLRAVAALLPLDEPQYGLLVLLPTDGRGVALKQLARELTTSPLRHVLSAMRPSRLHVTLPVFSAEGTVVLTSSLQQLGVWDIFDPRLSRLNRMSLDPGLFVRELEQSVHMDFGAVRAVHTRVVTARSAGEVLDAMRPFLYFVVDRETQTALMAGKIEDPSSAGIF